MNLKKCPFCGGDAEIWHEMHPPFCEYVYCKKCGFRTLKHIDAQNAIIDWNRRFDPPNDPLTLEQLREMGGEAVWVESLEGIRKSGFGIVHLFPPPSLGVVRKIWIFGGESEFWQDIPWPRSKKRQEYGKRWIAYRRKPEEGTT